MCFVAVCFIYKAGRKPFSVYMGASTSSCNPLPPPALSLLSSSKIHPQSDAAPWMPVLVPRGVDNLHQHPCAPRSLSTPRIHSEKNEHVPSITRKEFHMCVYTIRQVHHTVPSNSVSLYRIPHARLLNAHILSPGHHVSSYLSCWPRVSKTKFNFMASAYLFISCLPNDLVVNI